MGLQRGIDNAPGARRLGTRRSSPSLAWRVTLDRQDVARGHRCGNRITAEHWSFCSYNLDIGKAAGSQLILIVCLFIKPSGENIGVAAGSQLIIGRFALDYLDI